MSRVTQYAYDLSGEMGTGTAPNEKRTRHHYFHTFTLSIFARRNVAPATGD
jgi:hypothetical protein